MKNKIKSIGNIFHKLSYVLSHRQKALAVVVGILTLINAVLQTLGVSIILPLVNSMMSPQKVAETKYYSIISQLLHLHSTTDFFVLLCVSTIALYVIKNLFCIFQLWVSTKYSCKVQRELAISVLESYMNRSYDFFLGYGTTKIMRDVRGDAEGVNYILRAIFNLLTELLTMLMIMIYIVAMDWKMALCIMLIACICINILYVFFKKKTRKAGEDYRRAVADSQKVLLEAVEGIKEVQVMRKQSFFVKAFSKSYVKEQEPAIIRTILEVSPTYVIEGLFVSGLMGFICLRILFDTDYTNAVPLLASFMVGAVRMLPSLGRVSSNLNILSFQLPSLDSVYNNMHMFHENKEFQNCFKDIVDSGRDIIFSNELKLENVSWQYADSDREILHELNMSIHKGESIGVIGQSGAGKTTLIDIILGIHIPKSGRVTIDEIDIGSQLFEYSRVVGYVPQSVYLVDGTIRENVAFGVEKDLIDDNLIWEALNQAQLKDFIINETENGLETVVGERGVRFSGGQKQRLAIARALYRQPQILVLDEATSALDVETESAVMKAIENLQGTITIIIVAHRMSTVMNCDMIYEIREGKANVIDKGVLGK